MTLSPGANLETLVRLDQHTPPDTTSNLRQNTALTCWEVIDHTSLYMKDLHTVLDTLMSAHRPAENTEEKWRSLNNSLDILVYHGLWPRCSKDSIDRVYLWTDSINSIESMAKKITSGNWGTNIPAPFHEKFAKSMAALIWYKQELPQEMQDFFQENISVWNYQEFFLVIDQILFLWKFGEALIASWNDPLFHDIIKIILRIIVCQDHMGSGQYICSDCATTNCTPDACNNANPIIG